MNTWAVLGVGAASAAWVCSAPAMQPQLNPVYVDDSPVAAETLARVKDHVGSGNLDEAVRVLQVLLDEHGDRLTPSAGDDDIFESVRSRVHQTILSDAGLLARYRELLSPRAAGELERGNAAGVERSLLLTGSGMEAALRRAERELEAGRFEAARLTLEQLDRHPDRFVPGESGGDAALSRAAAELMSRTAAYLTGHGGSGARGEVRRMAERWAREAGLDATKHAGAIEAWPETARMRGESPLDALGPLSTEGLISKPLWTIALTQQTPTGIDFPSPRQRGAGNIPSGARLLEMLPTAYGDLLIVNDGTMISAWDRFTLSPRWTVQPGGATTAREQNDREMNLRRRAWGTMSGADALTVTIRGRYGAVASGRAPGLGRDGDDRVHGLDVQTGRVRWTKRLVEMDPSLADSAIRGPLEIDQGVVIVAARKHLPDRRLLSLTLVGLDVDTGEVLWVRPIGSAGWLPFNSQSFGPEGLTVDRGIVYRTDKLGVVAAVEVVSGRAAWIRRMPTEAGAMPTTEPQAWEVSRPLIDRDSVVVIAPDQREIVRLECASGRILGACPAGKFGEPSPAYLLKAGQYLVGVTPAGGAGASRIVTAPMAAFESAPASFSPAFEAPGVWGRVSVVGERLLAPVTGGIAVIDPARPEAEPLVQALDEPGNVLAVGAQLLVVDDSRAHSYLQWETAEAILSERMRADPRDPRPAVTFTELAYRAARPERIVPSVDAALAAIESAPELERNREARRRLFDTLHAVVNSGLEPEERPQDTPAKRGQAAATPRVEDRGILAALIERMDKAASTADDRVAVALAGGRLAELGATTASEAAAAAEMYQTVLDDPKLAMASWRGPSVSVRGELEAARRLEHLIAQHGPVVYAAQEAAASVQLAQMDPATSTPEQLESLASRYPLASVTPEVYLRLHTALKAGAGDRSAVGALELGLRAAQRIANPQDSAVGELAGRLLTELRARRQLAAAASMLRNVVQRFPMVTLTADGQPLDTAAIEQELRAAIAASMRWPRIGQVTSEGVASITGWSIMEPQLRDFRPHVNSCLVMESDREVGVWSAAPGATARVGDDETPVSAADAKDLAGMKLVYSQRLDDAGATLIRTTGDAAYLYISNSRVGGIRKVPLGAEGEGWQTLPISRLFPPGDETRGMNRAPGVMADQFETPDDGIVPSDDLLVVMDERTMALVQRGGRAVGIDTETGEALWSLTTPVSRVYDAQLVGGVLVVAGDSGKADPSGAIVDVTPAVQVIDARTGRLGQRLGDMGGRVRWVRLSDDGGVGGAGGAGGSLILGLENAVVSLDLATSQRNWTISNPDAMPAVASWVFGDRLLMLSGDRSLWLASLSSGRLGQRPLEAARSHIETTRDVEAYLTTSNLNGPFAVATHQGIMIFSATGELQGVDGLGGIDAMLTPRPTEDRAVAIETVSDGRAGEGLMRFTMHAMETTSAMLVDSHAVILGARPLEMEVLDGKIAVTAGGVTVIIPAPARK